MRGSEDEPNNVKYIFRGPINNHGTRDLIPDILEKRDVKDGPNSWKHRTRIEIDSPDGQALLGRANGAGVAYLLSQHRKQLGWKVIDYIEIYDDAVPREQRLELKKPSAPCLLFHIKDHDVAGSTAESVQVVGGAERAGVARPHDVHARMLMKGKL